MSVLDDLIKNSSPVGGKKSVSTKPSSVAPSSYSSLDTLIAASKPTTVGAPVSAVKAPVYNPIPYTVPRVQSFDANDATTGGIIKNTITGLPKAAVKVAKNVGNYLYDTAGGILAPGITHDELRDPQILKDTVTGLPKAAYQTVKQAVTHPIDTAETAVGSATRGVSDFVTNAIINLTPTKFTGTDRDSLKAAVKDTLDKYLNPDILKNKAGNTQISEGFHSGGEVAPLIALGEAGAAGAGSVGLPAVAGEAAGFVAGGQTQLPGDASIKDRAKQALQDLVGLGLFKVGSLAYGKAKGAIVDGLTDANTHAKLDSLIDQSKPQVADAVSQAPETAVSATTEGSKYDTPKVIEARANQGNFIPTSNIDTPERVALRDKILNEAYGEGAKNKNKRLDIVTGGPGSRKSSLLANPLAEEHGSIIADSDSIKPKIPEFGSKGEGANIVHKESALLNFKLLNKALDNNDNVVFPTVGRDPEVVKKVIDMAHDRGYEVHLHHAELNPDIAIPGTIERFEKGQQGFVDPKESINAHLQSNASNDIIKSYEKLRSQTKYSTDVKLGEPAKITETSGIRGSTSRQSGDLDRHGVRDVSEGTGGSDSSARSEPTKTDKEVLDLVRSKRKPGQSALDVAKKLGVEKEFTAALGAETRKLIKEKGFNLGTEKKAPVPLEPIGEGETKTSKLSLNIEANAIEKGLAQKFGDLPEYKTVNLKDQATKAADLLANDPDKAFRIAMGEEKAPEGVLPEMVLDAVERAAIKNGDAKTLLDLANSKLSTEATAMGQRIRALGERDQDSPVKAMQDVIKSREEIGKKKYGEKDLKKVKTKVVDDIKKEIKKAAPKKQDWNDFINSIKC